MRAFVTGATGFVGLNLVEQLVRAGWEVTAFHRPESDLALLQAFPVRSAAGDIRDALSVRRAMPEGADAVFHVAADTSLWSRRAAVQMRTNVGGTANVVAAALAAGARRFVYTSSWNAYGWVSGSRVLLREDSPRQGLESWINYDRSKALAELEVRRGIRRGLAAVIVNPSHVLGRYDVHGWARLVRLAARGRLPGVPSGSGTFCHAEQVALAHIEAAGRGRIGDNYLLGGADASFLELVRTVGRLAGRPEPRRVVPAVLLKSVARLSVALAAITGREPALTPEGAALVTANPRIASDKARRELGYRPVTLQVMLEDSYRWLNGQGLLAAE